MAKDKTAVKEPPTPKVLKITKPDRTVHVVPIGNKAFYQHMNNKVYSPEQQLKIEEINEPGENDEPIAYIDETYLTGTEAKNVVPDMQKRIDELEAKLREINSDSMPSGAKAATVKQSIGDEKVKATIDAANKKDND